MRSRLADRMLVGAARWIVVAALLTLPLTGCKKKTPPPAQPAGSPTAQPIKTPVAQPAAPTPEPKPTGLTLPKVKLTEVIQGAKSWTAKKVDPGITVPDISLTDLQGGVHKLSSYRGRNVLINFWASWCPHCKVEMPQLGQLRNDIPASELAILAVSLIDGRNPESAIRAAVQGQSSINYPVVATKAATLPAPLNQVDFLPCNVFIDPEGRIKLITEGLVPLADIKSILRAR